MIAHGTPSAYTKLNCRCLPCKAAIAEYHRNRRASRPDVREKDRQNSLAYAKKMRAYLISQKNKPCTDCKIQYPYYVMHFDHLGLEPKLFNLSQKMYSKRKIIEEIAKCELVCANCHAERTHRRLIAIG